MANFLDYITARAQGLYWNELKSKETEVPFLGDELFPSRKKIGLGLDWIKGANQASVVLHLSAFDAKVLKRNRIGFKTMSAKMPFFKDSMDIDEELRQKLLMLGESQIQYIQELIRKIFDDNTTLLKSAKATVERMRMQLITTGTIAIANNGQEYLYDYGMEEHQKQTVAKSWADPTADIIGDIQAYQDIMIAKTGVKPTRLVMRTSMFRNIMKNTNIKNAVFVFGQGNVNVSEGAVKAYLAEQLGITGIALNDKFYVDEEGNTQYYVPADTVVMLPEGQIGTTWYGTTPEEADLLGSKEADVFIVDTGVAITVTKETDPVRKVTKVSEICLPSAENIDKVLIIDALGA